MTLLFKKIICLRNYLNVCEFWLKNKHTCMCRRLSPAAQYESSQERLGSDFGQDGTAGKLTTSPTHS